MDLETVLCSGEGFGLESASFLQRAICRITDGRELTDLLARGTEAQRQSVEAAMGCSCHDIPTGAPPTELVDLEPVRCGKSLRYAALAVTRSQTVDVGIIKAGEEPPRISLLATSLDQAATLRGHLNIINERPKLRALKIGDDADSVTLRHPSGCPIQIKVIAAARGGYSLASRWSASVIFDEAPGWYSTDRIVSLEESREQALGRLLGGAQAIYGGSPWQPHGFCFEAFTAHWGKPTRDLVVVKAAPAWELNPVYWTQERVERIKRTSPRTYKMHLLAEFGTSQNAAFDYSAVMGAFRRVAQIPSWYRPGPSFLSIDASSLAGDAFAFSFYQWLYPPRDKITKMVDIVNQYGQVTHAGAMVARDADGNVLYEDTDPRPMIWVYQTGAWEGEDLAQASMEGIVGTLAQTCRQYGVQSVVGDQRESASLLDMFRRHGLSFTAYPWTNESKEAAVNTLARLLRERRMWIAEDQKLRQEMLAYGYRLLPGGKFQFQGRLGADDRVATLITFAHALNAGNGEYPNVRTELSS